MFLGGRSPHVTKDIEQMHLHYRVFEGWRASRHSKSMHGLGVNDSQTLYFHLSLSF